MHTQVSISPLALSTSFAARLTRQHEPDPGHCDYITRYLRQGPPGVSHARFHTLECEFRSLQAEARAWAAARPGQPYPLAALLAKCARRLRLSVPTEGGDS